MSEAKQMLGWIALHRGLLDHWIFDFKEPDKALAWIFMLLKANHKTHKMKIKGSLVEVKRGQLGMSQVTLEKTFGWSKNKVRRFLDLLEKEEMITLETNHLTTLISICNFESYQPGGTSDETAHETTCDTPDGPVTEQHSEHKQECNNDNNEKNKKASLDFSSWPEQPDKEFLMFWKQARTKKKAANPTQRSINSIGNQLCKAIQMGYTFEQCITRWEEKSWVGFKADWMSDAKVLPFQQSTKQIKML